MSNTERSVYLLTGLLIFLICGWLTVAAVSAVANNPDATIFGIPTSIWIATLASIGASGIFFLVSEALRWSFDRSVGRCHRRLHFYEHTVGILDFFSQKGSDAANYDYGSAIASARNRVWAFGISNGEFISEHLDGLVAKKKKFPQLDVCICFVDPDTTLCLQTSARTEKVSLVSLFDITRDDGLVTDNSSRVVTRVHQVRRALEEARVSIDIRLISAGGYLSAMVVDEIIYLFPFTAVSKDNTRTPYLKINVHSSMGHALVEFLTHLKNHPRLSRAAQ